MEGERRGGRCIRNFCFYSSQSSSEAASLNRDSLGNVLKIPVASKSLQRIGSFCSPLLHHFFLTQDFAHNNVHTSGKSQTQQTSHSDCRVYSQSTSSCQRSLQSERPRPCCCTRGEQGYLLGSSASSCFSRLPRKNFQGTECSIIHDGVLHDGVLPGNHFLAVSDSLTHIRSMYSSFSGSRWCHYKWYG